MNANTLHQRTPARPEFSRRSWRGILFLALLAAILPAAGCSFPDANAEKDDSPPGPSTEPRNYSDFTGIWEGTLFEATSGNFGEVVLTAHQSGSKITGTWTAIYPTVVNGGTMEGQAVTGDTMHVVLQPSNRYFCPIDVTVYVEVGTHAQGNYASLNCQYLQTGIIETWRNIMGTGYHPAPPDTPANFTATPGAGEVTLEWAHVKLASGYNLYYDVSPLDVKNLAVAKKVEHVTSPYILGGLTNDVTYDFVVVSSNLDAESAPSIVVTATPRPL